MSVDSGGGGEPLYDFDVALTYASEDRSYVQAVAAGLREQGIQVFYDEFFNVEIWGQDVFTYLDEVYRQRAKYIVMFISAAYANKDWTNHERRSAQARALSSRMPTVLPVVLDDSIIPGIPPSLGSLDGRELRPEEIIAAIVNKLADIPGTTMRPVMGIWRTPRDEPDIRQLLEERPRAWEYLLFGGYLAQFLAQHEESYLDFTMGFGRINGRHLSTVEAPAFLTQQFAVASRIAKSVELVLSSHVQEAAFGPPGQAGDALKIRHLARRTIDIYAAMLDWAANLRGTVGPEGFDEAFEAIALMNRGPIEETRNFVHRTVQELDTLSERLDSGDTVEITLHLTFDIEPEVTARVDAAFERIRETYGHDFAVRV